MKLQTYEAKKMRERPNLNSKDNNDGIFSNCVDEMGKKIKPFIQAKKYRLAKNFSLETSTYKN